MPDRRLMRFPLLGAARWEVNHYPISSAFRTSRKVARDHVMNCQTAC